MSLRDKLQLKQQASQNSWWDAFGFKGNPFPTASQTSWHPHYPIPEDGEAEDRIAAFIREKKSEVLAVLGTQGVGKTNFLNYLENEIHASELKDCYIVRYMADPEPSFDAMMRTILQELGIEHLRRVVGALSGSDESREALSTVKSYDLRQALLSLLKEEDEERYRLCIAA